MDDKTAFRLYPIRRRGIQRTPVLLSVGLICLSAVATPEVPSVTGDPSIPAVPSYKPRPTVGLPGWQEGIASPRFTPSPNALPVRPASKHPAWVSVVTNALPQALADGRSILLPRLAAQPKGIPEFILTSPAGIRQPKANLSLLAEQTELELRRNGLLQDRGLANVVRTLLDKQPSTPEIDSHLEETLGLTLAELKSDVERDEVQYWFAQTHDGVPIEGMGIVAMRRADDARALFRARFLKRYAIGNVSSLSAAEAEQASLASLGSDAIALGLDEGGATELVLLQVPESSAQGSKLRFAWRTTHRLYRDGEWRIVRLWLDAQDARVLLRSTSAGPSAQPLPAPSPSERHIVVARGAGWTRNPQSGVEERTFEVDAAVNGKHRLSLQGTSRQLDSWPHSASAPNEGRPAPSLMIDVDQRQPLTADFRPAIGSGESASCEIGDRGFDQVNLFSQLHWFRRQAAALGVFPSFPARDWEPQFVASEKCEASNSSLIFPACAGYRSPQCPEAHVAKELDNRLHYGHDGTIVAHEFGHLLVDQMTWGRPAPYCGLDCQFNRLGLTGLHDLADAWADHFFDTNCTGGWVAKNVGGVDASRDCHGTRGHSEESELPRLHEVTTPFSAASPGDHFPEHRQGPRRTSDYADMQIAAAALWQVREGLRGLDRAASHPQYAVHLLRAIRDMQVSDPEPGAGERASDLHVYRVLHELEWQLVKQWVEAGPGATDGQGRRGSEPTNKVLAGFARAGLFLIAPECLDAAPVAASRGKLCSAGDAVIDVQMPDSNRDAVVDGVRRRQAAYVDVGGLPPTFHVWTGPRYSFTKTRALPIQGLARCHARYRIEVSIDPAFSRKGTVSSGWRTVPTDNYSAYPTPCYGQWIPSEHQWESMQLRGQGTRFYYRATTRNVQAHALRVSTRPAAGQFKVRPPFFTLTAPAFERAS